MTSRHDQLRARIAEIQKRGPSHRRYGVELKRAIVEHAQNRRQGKASVRQIAGELGLSASNLRHWLQLAARWQRAGRNPFAPIERPTIGAQTEEDMQWNTYPAAAVNDTKTDAEDSESETAQTSQSDDDDIMLVVRCSQVHIHGIARKRIRELLDM